MPCPLCDDTGWKPVERRIGGCGASCAATAGATNLGQQRLAEAQHSDALPALHDRQLHGLQRVAASRRSAQARRIAEAFPVVSKGLFLGQPGVGKTHLAVAVLQAA